MRNKTETLIVFDMDETLGHFVELSIFCDIIETLNKRKLRYREFRDILDLFPEFLRPNIIRILNYVKRRKENNDCDRVIIYTNNQGPNEWAQFVVKYLEEKIKYKLFDQIIGAYKVGTVQNEMRRTSHEKNVSDLMNCCNTSKTSNICFLDDQFHNRMRGNNVYYINIKPFVFILPYEEMATRYYIKNSRKIIDKNKWMEHIVTNMNNSNYHNLEFTENSPNVDNELGKEALFHIQQFFKLLNTTKTGSKNSQGKTKKRRY